MINYLQSNHYNISTNFNIFTDKFVESLITKLKTTKKNKLQLVIKTCKKYNIQKREFILQFIAYLISNKPGILNSKFISYLLGELESVYNVL